MSRFNNRLAALECRLQQSPHKTSIFIYQSNGITPEDQLKEAVRAGIVFADVVLMLPDNHRLKK